MISQSSQNTARLLNVLSDSTASGELISDNTCLHKQRHWLMNIMDASGALASGVCAVHCMATPIFLAFAPAIGGLFSHHAIHNAMFLLVLPIAIISLGFSAWRSKKWGLLLFGLLGCSLLALGLELEHEYQFGLFSPATWVNIAGGIILASAHIYNLKIRANHKYC